MALAWHLGSPIPDSEVYWTIDGEQYAPHPARNSMAAGREYRPLSLHVCCPECGRVWAQRLVTNQGSNRLDAQMWTFRLAKCKHCPPGPVYPYPGSLWNPYDPSWNAMLPYEAVVRELDLISLENRNEK